MNNRIAAAYKRQQKDDIARPEGEVVLKTENVYKIYRDDKISLEVLKGISLEVKKQELLCIIGPSGAGKSTLLHLLGGLDEPTTGSVLFKGEDFFAMGENQRSRIRNKNIGFVFQFYHLLPELTAVENVMLPALIQGMRRAIAEQNAERLLKQVGLEMRLIHKPGQLSGGEQQRVAIARTLINDPEVILCDEPTGNLDSERGAQIAELLHYLNYQKEKTIVIVSHDEGLAKIAKRIVHIRDGQLVNS
ncbi:MAG: ABC transporter ATP-binding protein [Candidatus Omnitrophota bacterium]